MRLARLTFPLRQRRPACMRCRQPVLPAPPTARSIPYLCACRSWASRNTRPDFKHFDFVNPDAPKGGELQAAPPIGSFDSFNPFIVKGEPAAGIGALFETLLVQSPDEADTAYGLLAQSIETARRPAAGSPSTCGPRRASRTARRSRPRTWSSPSTS